MKKDKRDTQMRGEEKGGGTNTREEEQEQENKEGGGVEAKGRKEGGRMIEGEGRDG